MKVLQMRLYPIFNKIAITIGLLVAGFSSISASDDSLNNSLSSMSMQDSASDESMNDSLHDDTDKPDVELYFQADLENHTYNSSDFPLLPNFSSKKYNRNEIVLRDSLVKSMAYMIICLVSPRVSSDNWLREINGRNAKFMDLHVQARILPESKKIEQTGILRIVPNDMTTIDDVFSQRAKAIVNRFKKRGINLDIQLYLYENLQDFKDDLL